MDGVGIAKLRFDLRIKQYMAYSQVSVPIYTYTHQLSSEASTLCSEALGSPGAGRSDQGGTKKNVRYVAMRFVEGIGTLDGLPYEVLKNFVLYITNPCTSHPQCTRLPSATHTHLPAHPQGVSCFWVVHLT